MARFSSWYNIPNLFFTVTAGGTGTKTLAKLFRTFPDFFITHQYNYPKANDFKQQITLNPDKCISFWEKRLDNIKKQKQTNYIETSHIISKGFIEGLFELEIIPNIIILRRNLRQISKFMVYKDIIPNRTETGRTTLFNTYDPGVCIIKKPDLLTDYQLCFWYCIEMEKRALEYKNEVLQKGGKVFETNIVDLTTNIEEINKLIKTFEIEKVNLKKIKQFILKNHEQNKSNFKRNPKLDELEKEVFKLTNIPDYTKEHLKKWTNNVL